MWLKRVEKNMHLSEPKKDESLVTSNVCKAIYLKLYSNCLEA